MTSPAAVGGGGRLQATDAYRRRRCSSVHSPMEDGWWVEQWSVSFQSAGGRMTGVNVARSWQSWHR